MGTPLERSKLVKEWVELVGEQVSVKLSETSSKGGRPGNAAATARQLGIHEREVQRSVKIASLSPEAQATRQGHNADLAFLGAATIKRSWGQTTSPKHTW